MENSGDIYSRIWIKPSYQNSVSSLWNEYSSVVYDQDDIVLSVRTRIIKSALNNYVGDNSTVILMPCGFVSYPYFLPEKAKYIEVDMADLIDYKSEIAKKNQASGVLPARAIKYIPLDIYDLMARGNLIRRLSKIREKIFVLEGISYYLNEKVWWEIINEITSSCSSGDVIIFDYWPYKDRSKLVYERFRLFCNKYMITQIGKFLFLKRSDIITCLPNASLTFRSVVSSEKDYLGKQNLKKGRILNDSCVVAVIK